MKTQNQKKTLEFYLDDDKTDSVKKKNVPIVPAPTRKHGNVRAHLDLLDMELEDLSGTAALAIAVAKKCYHLLAFIIYYCAHL